MTDVSSQQAAKPALRAGIIRAFQGFAARSAAFSSLVGMEPSLAGHIFVMIEKLSGKVRQAARNVIGESANIREAHLVHQSMSSEVHTIFWGLVVCQSYCQKSGLLNALV